MRFGYSNKINNSYSWFGYSSFSYFATKHTLNNLCFLYLTINVNLIWYFQLLSYYHTWMLKPLKALLKRTSISSKLKQFHKCFEFKYKIQPLIFLLSLLLVLPNLFELEYNNSTKNFKEVSKINLFCFGTIAVFFFSSSSNSLVLSALSYWFIVMIWIMLYIELPNCKEQENDLLNRSI